MSKRVVFGIVKTEAEASSLVTALNSAGFVNSDISALFPDKKGTRDFAHEKNTKAPEGAVVGAGAGGVAGGAFGLLLGIGALAIPGFGPLIAAGPLLAALSGAAVGGAVGGLAGGLVGMGIPELEAKQYEGKIKDGNILVSVHAEDMKQADLAKDIFKQCQVSDISTSMEASVPNETKRPAPVSKTM